MAATITVFYSVQSRLTLSWDVGKAVAGLANALSNTGGITAANIFVFGTASGLFANQVVTGLLTINGGATNNFAMDTIVGLTTALGDTGATMTAIKEMLWELLSTGQTSAGGIAGSATTSITLGAHATTPWDSGPLGATDTYTMRNGDKWHSSSATAGGMLISATDILKIVNNDGAVAAKLQVTLLGVA